MWRVRFMGEAAHSRGIAFGPCKLTGTLLSDRTEGNQRRMSAMRMLCPMPDGDGAPSDKAMPAGQLCGFEWRRWA